MIDRICKWLALITIGSGVCIGTGLLLALTLGCIQIGLWALGFRGNQVGEAVHHALAVTLAWSMFTLPIALLWGAFMGLSNLRNHQ